MSKKYTTFTVLMGISLGLIMVNAYADKPKCKECDEKVNKCITKCSNNTDQGHDRGYWHDKDQKQPVNVGACLLKCRIPYNLCRANCTQ